METKELVIEYSDRKVSAWGGMKLMKDLVDRTGIKDELRKLPLPARGSNRGYDPITIIESFWTSIWIGARWFCHSEMLRYDSVLKGIFGWKEVPSQSTFSRFFHKFSWFRNDAVFPEAATLVFRAVEF